MPDIYEESVALHKRKKGKLAIKSKVPLKDRHDLSMAYTPGVARVCEIIAKDPKSIYTYTQKRNAVAVISDGTAVLGLGNIGPEAALPVMEGKAILFKAFANVDAYPLCIRASSTQELIQTIKNVSVVFGGINLEDIKAPECFTVEAALQDLGIPVMHDDQHGTAIVLLAALINACRVTGRNFSDLTIVINGAGAAGIAIATLLLCLDEPDRSVCVPVKDVRLVDTKGVIYDGRVDIEHGSQKERLARVSNRAKIQGNLATAVKGADVFIGVSKANLLSKDMVRSMNTKPIIFAMANPEPEIMPDDAKEAGAAIVATGRSDFPNQANNVLAFPGVFRGALDAKAIRISVGMKIAAAHALANYVLTPTADAILPSPLDKGVARAVAAAVRKQARKEKVIRND